MSRLHLFNPGNDLALANGSAYFTAPKSATELATSAAALPLWYANDGDYFVGAVNRSWYEQITNTFGINIKPTQAYIVDTIPEPWGWSSSAKRQYSLIGVPKEKLPSDDELQAWRALSSRVAGAGIITALMRQCPQLVGGDPEKYYPRIAHTESEAISILSTMSRAMIKLPWSNAGRGQQDTAKTTPAELQRRINGMITRQGCVEISPFYDGILDFAMLFSPEGFMGYSLFTTDSHGGWTGNILKTDTEIKSHIELTANLNIDLNEVANETSKLIEKERIQTGYSGHVGVDFMVARLADGRTIMPPIEINWRHTMGHVAHEFRRKFMADGSSGSMMIVDTTSQIPFGATDKCYVSNGKINQGTLDLVPAGGSFRVIADVGMNL